MADKQYEEKNNIQVNNFHVCNIFLDFLWFDGLVGDRQFYVSLQNVSLCCS